MAKTRTSNKTTDVKIPQTMRRAGEGFASMLRHPLVAGFAAGGLIVAAAALRDNPKLKAAGRKAKQKAGKAAQEIGAGAASLGTVIATAAKDGVERVGEAYQAIEHNGSGARLWMTGGAKSGKAKSKGTGRQRAPKG